MTESKALEASKILLDDVKSLLENHPAANQAKRGRPTGGVGVDPLLRSCVALCYAAWEVYVEEALHGAVEYIIENLDADRLPASLRKWVATTYGKNDPWKFAGDGWKLECMNLINLRLYGKDGQNGFNSANSKAVKSLYLEILGYEPLSEISWQGMPNQRVVEEIEALVYERGAIVHTGVAASDGKAKGKLGLPVVRSQIDFIKRLREQFDSKLNLYLSELVGGDLDQA
ncbi:HEPN domain-containing protein [Brevibacterium sp. JSBI002]|uniref:HEPN domain-containing protein n=1 Tax=Brevibacterium sp. JSBI002 TaxID=2886045 RepID=UPI0022308C36|nr:HEPN domain-containing protein [Brevibacterium sp. JSBI002]UZD61120.1 HEPN domain-containing protein [Brevibacterium sp. JSBI002]